jgi:hypothetical protein
MAGMVGLAFADLKDHIWMHRVCAFLGLSGLIGYESSSCRLALPGMSGWEKILRIGTQITAWLSFTLAAGAEAVLSSRTCITWSTWGEYFCLFSLDAYVLSYYRALRSSEVVLLCDWQN